MAEPYNYLNHTHGGRRRMQLSQGRAFCSSACCMDAGHGGPHCDCCECGPGRRGRDACPHHYEAPGQHDYIKDIAVFGRPTLPDMRYIQRRLSAAHELQSQVRRVLDDCDACRAGDCLYHTRLRRAFEAYKNCEGTDG